MELQNISNVDMEQINKFMATIQCKYDKNVFLTLTVSFSSWYIKNQNSGLGNMLFQIASGLSYSMRYNANLNIIDIQRYLLSEEYDKQNHILRRFNDNPNYALAQKTQICTSNDNQEFIFNNEFHDNIHFSNYYENFNNFEEIKNVVIYCFSPIQSDIDYILTKYPVLNDDDICSVHIRMGPDYNRIYGNNSEHIKILENNYKKCIDHMISYKNIKKFFVFTNDKEYSMSLFTDTKYNNIQFYYSTERDYVDIWMMSLIKNNIVSVSTLSWWGSYLNTHKDKYIVCSKGNRDFLHYPGWIVL